MRLVVAAEQLVAVDEPERARQEDALARRQPVDARTRPVPEHEPVAEQLPLDPLDRASHPRVGCGQEADQRNHEQARIELL